MDQRENRMREQASVHGDAGAEADAEVDLPLIAYCLNPQLVMPIVPAVVNRDWMDATDRRFANRCLPLLIANQSGWQLLSGHRIAVTWNGEATLDALKVEYLAGDPPYPASSHFGSGIVTWNLPYLFRTPLGFNLLVRGPTNWPKDGISPMDGIVETDWAEATFTMNWKMTRANHTVVFEVGEPIAMVVPQARGEIECFRPVIRDIMSEPELYQAYSRWNHSRAEFNAGLRQPGSAANKQGWQKHYLRGSVVDETPAEKKKRWFIDHQTSVELRDFIDERSASPAQSPVDSTPSEGD